MKRTYSKDFKIKECKLVSKDNIAVSVVAEEFSVHHVMVLQWVANTENLETRLL